ncbi:hypothetical protein H6798_03895 [Candidatus Nomurabacteria bacterium]|nr:hypothetical protein [Candidatus Nomurabacteria bacterium]
MTKSVSTKSLVLGVVIIFALILPSLTKVEAHNGGADNSNDSSKTESESETEHAVDEGEVERRLHDYQEHAAEARHERQDDSERTEARLLERKTKCEERKDRIADKMNGLHGRGVAFGQKVDSFVKRIDNFVTTNNLVVDNYDQLLANVESAQTKLAESLTVAAQLRTGFSCEDPDEALDDVDAYKAALAQVKLDAKAVISEVKALANAVKQAAQEQLNLADDNDSETN